VRQTTQFLYRTNLAVINKVRGAALAGALILAAVPEKGWAKQEK
jgi:hypothetical protein